ncbi:MAG: DUF1592 domain-containing protein [Planctomycetota bacterium]
MKPLTKTTFAAIALALFGHTLWPEGEAPASDDDVFVSEVRPVLEKYCFACHGPEKQRGSIRFDTIDPDMVRGDDAETWPAVRDALGAAKMPPESAPQPSDDERRALVSWLNASLEAAARETATKQRSVLRRLNKQQYTASLQELLGLSIDFGQELPDDGRSKMGFTNNGEVLLTSPLHLELYQDIAREALDQAIVLGERPEPTQYLVTFGQGIGRGLPGATTGGYQSVPLSPDDFKVDILDADGQPKIGATEEEQRDLDRIKRKITIGFRGSSQDRFFSTPEGVVLYSALPHKEVAPGAWQGPSPNMKLEMQRVFPERGDFVMRVTASRGFLVNEKKELLVSLDDPEPRASLIFAENPEEPSAADLRTLEPTVLGPWYQAGPFFTTSGEDARDTQYVPRRTGIDFEAPLADGESRWTEVGQTDGEVRQYETKIGALILARAIDAPSARTMEIGIGSDDAVFVWLNGEEILTADVRRGVGRDQNFLSLDLVEGRNELILKVVNYGGGFASFHRVVHDGTSAGIAPYEVVVPDSSKVLRSDLASSRSNLRFEKGGVVAVDFPEDSGAEITADIAAGYYQFDLVHRAMPVDAMGSIRFEVGELKLDLRPKPTPEQLEDGYLVTTIGGGYLNDGRHEIRLGGPFFVGFSHLVLTPLEPDHPLVVRLEERARAEESKLTPALRAFIGTRTDDGMDYRNFDAPRSVEAERGRPQVYSFQGRLENLPIPEPESGDDEILSGICVLGVWNDHLVKSRRETGPPLLVKAIEFEAPYNPVWPPESHTRIFFDSENREDEEAYTREVLSRFLERAFRRQVPEKEVERYLGFWRSVRGEFDHYEESVKETLVAALCSPSFLFLAEPVAELAEGGPISEEVLASRLSYFLWSSPPDAELSRLAREGRLRESLDAQVNRLLDDPRSDRFVRAFTREWLRLDRLEGMTINPNLFPAFTRFVKEDMAEETYRFVGHALRKDLDVLTLIDSDFTILNQNLAEFYGIEGVEGVAFRPVPVTPEQGRGGLLSQGAFLAGHSNGNEPHPIKRAVWVKERILGKPPLPPPPNVPDLDPDAPGFDKLTLKEQIERHRDNPSCRDCHASFDPYGIALETYDAVGLKQAMRKGRPVDAETELPDGTVVDGADGLKAYIRDEVPEQFVASLIKHLFAYALGRDVGFADAEELADIRMDVLAQGDTMRAVIQAIVYSRSFSER